MANFEFRRPLGLALSGGSALGAWQAGYVWALERAGLRFDRVFGFSAGAMCGAAYFAGRLGDLPAFWREIGTQRMLRWQPRLSPFSLFSNSPLREAVALLGDERTLRETGRCELTIAALRWEDREPVYSRFAPGAGGAWDGPFTDRLVASCSIPRLFPPVAIRDPDGVHHYVDGGAMGRRPLDFSSLRGCADVLVIEMVRPEERARRSFSPLGALDQVLRLMALRQMDAGVASLLALPEKPRVFRLMPSRPLGYPKYSYRSEHCALAVDQGIAEAEAFLVDPEARLVSAA